jgi:hypothetical protein
MSCRKVSFDDARLMEISQTLAALTTTRFSAIGDCGAGAFGEPRIDRSPPEEGMGIE